MILICIYCVPAHATVQFCTKRLWVKPRSDRRTWRNYRNESFGWKPKRGSDQNLDPPSSRFIILIIFFSFPRAATKLLQSYWKTTTTFSWVLQSVRRSYRSSEPFSHASLPATSRNQNTTPSTNDWPIFSQSQHFYLLSTDAIHIGRLHLMFTLLYHNY